MNKILVVEDELSIQKMIEYDLWQIGLHVVCESDGLKGYELATTGEFSLIILDLMLPSMSGFEISEKLRALKPRPYILMLTAMDDEVNKIQGFHAGADDYVTKPFSPRELTARIKAVLRRQKETAVTDGHLIYESIEMDLNAYSVKNAGALVTLTLKEFELLKHFIENTGMVLSRDQLLVNLWGYQYDGDSRVVDVHIFNLREKLPILHEKMNTIRGIGYQLT
jgi:two-component system alkaline phosphatase synthesis response regulator PhoP